MTKPLSKCCNAPIRIGVDASDRRNTAKQSICTKCYRVCETYNIEKNHNKWQIMTNKEKEAYDLGIIIGTVVTGVLIRIFDLFLDK